MNDVTLDLTVAEALIALGAIQDKMLDASRLAAISSGEEHEIADLSAKLLGGIATRITDALYEPRNCGAHYTHLHHRGCDGVDDGPHDDYDERPPVDYDREGDPAFNGAFNRW